MPKMKTKSGAKKRFRFTASGKVKHGVVGKRHGMTKRGNRFLRQQTGMNIGVHAVNYKASLPSCTPTTAPRTPYRTSSPWPTNARIRRSCWADTRRVRR